MVVNVVEKVVENVLVAVDEAVVDPVVVNVVEKVVENVLVEVEVSMVVSVVEKVVENVLVVVDEAVVEKIVVTVKVAVVVSVEVTAVVAVAVSGHELDELVQETGGVHTPAVTKQCITVPPQELHVFQQQVPGWSMIGLVKCSSSQGPSLQYRF